MKQLLFIVCMAVSLAAQAQDWEMAAKKEEKGKTEIKVKPEHIRLYLMAPGSFGDNVLNKAYNGSQGAGLMVTFYTYRKHYICGGFDFSIYKVEDVSLAANVTKSNISNFYLAYMYKVPISERMSLNPRLSLGSITIDQRKDGDSYGKQQGVGYGAAIDIDYGLAENTKVFLGLNYTLLKPETHTIRELKSFYDTLHQFNIALGVKF